MHAWQLLCSREVPGAACCLPRWLGLVLSLPAMPSTCCQLGGACSRPLQPPPINAPHCPWAVALAPLLISQFPPVSSVASAQGARGLPEVSCCFLSNAPAAP